MQYEMLVNSHSALFCFDRVNCHVSGEVETNKEIRIFIMYGLTQSNLYQADRLQSSQGDLKIAQSSPIFSMVSNSPTSDVGHT